MSTNAEPRAAAQTRARVLAQHKVADYLRASLALDALEMAIFAREGQIGRELVHHSDRGVQGSTPRSVTSSGWRTSARVRSVGSKGDSCDNAAAEAMNSLYKKELIDFEGRLARRWGCYCGDSGMGVLVQ
jgi:putative transposase